MVNTASLRSRAVMVSLSADFSELFMVLMSLLFTGPIIFRLVAPVALISSAV